MTYPDWRVGPDPLLCVGCRATEAGCENRRMFSSRRCCEFCSHEPLVQNVLGGVVIDEEANQ